MRRGVAYPLVRVFVLASFGVGAAVWALQRAYSPKPPMVVPVVESGDAANPDQGWTPAENELVAPELVGDPAKADPSVPGARE